MPTMQQLVLSNPALTAAFMSRAPASMHERAGERNRRHVLEVAARRTKAYPAFLAEHGISAEDALQPDTWERLPLTSKRDYMDRFSLADRALDGDLGHAYAVEKSSGHSGGCYYWLRMPEEDALLPSYMDYAFRQFYGVDKRHTLIIIGLALGTWVSGEKMGQALREIAASKQYPMSVITPGMNLPEILDIVRDLSPLYEQTVIVGYPPFLRSMVDEGAEAGIDWPRLNVKLGLGGEGYSEEWRIYMGQRLGVDATTDLLAVSGGYGAADLGMSVGREYPLTVLIRQLATSDPMLAEALFGSEDVPNLFQYNPGAFFIEEVDGELVYTCMSGIPLVRYRIRDRGGVLSFDRVMAELVGHGYDVRSRLEALGYEAHDLWQLPFFTCYGRADGSVSVDGALVYPENLATLLSGKKDADILGWKMARAGARGSGRPRLLVLLEHRDADLPEDERERLEEYYTRRLAGGLRRINMDYRKVYEGAPKLAEPIVKVHGRGKGPFGNDIGQIKKDYLLREA